MVVSRVMVPPRRDPLLWVLDTLLLERDMTFDAEEAIGVYKKMYKYVPFYTMAGGRILDIKK